MTNAPLKCPNFTRSVLRFDGFIPPLFHVHMAMLAEMSCLISLKVDESCVFGAFQCKQHQLMVNICSVFVVVVAFVLHK